MRLTTRTVVSSIALLFSMAATSCKYDNAAEKARKPGLVDSLVELAVNETDTGKIAAEGGADFRTRLRTVLMGVETRNLALLKDRNIVVTLDQRLAAQQEGFFDRRIDGVYYNNGQAPVLALWDNGKAKGESGFLNMNTYDYGVTMVDKLAQGVREHDLDGVALAIAGRYRNGKHSSTTRWKAADDFDHSSQKKNEAILRKAPRRTTRSGGTPKPGGNSW